MNHKPSTIPQAVLGGALAAFDESDAYDRKNVWTYSDDYDLDTGDTDFRVTFSMANDYCTSLEDFECYGKIALVDHRDRYCNEYGHPTRPEGFDGDARKIAVGGDTYWWQPMWKEWGVDRADLTPDRIRREVSQIRDLLEYGFYDMSVTIEYRCQCCGTWAEVGFAAFGGIEPFITRDDGKEYAADVLHEAVAQSGLGVVA